MEDKHDIHSYTKLEEAANFFLNESFRYIHLALSSELSMIIFTELIEKVEVTATDRKIIQNVNLPSNTISLLQEEFEDLLTPDTLNKLSIAWEHSQRLDPNIRYSFSKSHPIVSIELLGHLNNFAFFIETLTNRHLLFLKHTDKFNSLIYNQISMAKILNRLIFICRDEIGINTIQLNEIANLFSLRNKTVHYTPDNAISLQINLEALLKIWKQTIKLIKLFESREKFNENKFSEGIRHEIKKVESKWIVKNKKTSKS